MTISGPYLASNFKYRRGAYRRSLRVKKDKEKNTYYCGSHWLGATGFHLNTALGTSYYKHFSNLAQHFSQIFLYVVFYILVALKMFHLRHIQAHLMELATVKSRFKTIYFLTYKSKINYHEKEHLSFDSLKHSLSKTPGTDVSIKINWFSVMLSYSQ